ncbi:MAG: linear amide C-N hydrolase [Candidatus Zixiibacteriota bacterium]|nr:MAG: linear amide C-N hydrolase [candidate division Zixibacteria bacterium]
MMKTSSLIRFLLVLSAICLAGAGDSFPCSTFVLQSEGDLVFGRNWDFFSSKGLVVINKRDVAKTAFLAPPENPVSWVSKYGSITFNQIGKEFPFGGMNEAGLVVETMWLDETVYPAPDERPGIMEVQWIQYQLDNCATVEEVIATHDRLRIARDQSASKLHFLICDRSGKAATVEFLGGRLVSRTGNDLPVAALTNSTYRESLQFRKAYDSLEPAQQINNTSLDSKERFATIARRIRDYRRDNIRPTVEYAFDILGSVTQGKFGRHCTAWTVVYDIRNMQIYFKTYENRELRIVSFADFDFSCPAPSLVFDMGNGLTGEVSTKFIAYTPEANRNLVSSVMAIYNEVGFMDEVSPAAIELLSGYPESLGCR